MSPATFTGDEPFIAFRKWCCGNERMASRLDRRAAASGVGVNQPKKSSDQKGVCRRDSFSYNHSITYT